MLMLMLMAWRIGSFEAISLLLDRGADVSIEDRHSRNAFDYATGAKHRFTAEQYSVLWTRQQSLLKLPPDQQTSPPLLREDYSVFSAYRYVAQLRDQCEQDTGLMAESAGEVSFEFAQHTPETELTDSTENCHELIRHLTKFQKSHSAWYEQSVSLLIRELPDTLAQKIAQRIVFDKYEQGQTKAVQTYLSDAIANDKPKLARYLLEMGADVNRPTTNNSHPIIEASKLGQESLVKHLVASGADLSVRDVFGRTAFLAAIARGHHGVAEELIAAGSDPRVKDINGMDASMLATQ